MSHWRKRIGARFDLLLAETLRLAEATRRDEKERHEAGDGGHDGAAPKHHLPDWRQTDAHRHPAARKTGQKAWVCRCAKAMRAPPRGQR